MLAAVARGAAGIAAGAFCSAKSTDTTVGKGAHADNPSNATQARLTREELENIEVKRVAYFMMLFSSWRIRPLQLAQLLEHLVRRLNGFGIHLVGTLGLDHGDQFLDDIHVGCLKKTLGELPEAIGAGNA